MTHLGASDNPSRERLDEALARLRQVFGKAHGSPNWCDALDAVDSSTTLRQRVWELSQRDYDNFAWHSVCGYEPSERIAAMRYFLPRLASDLSLRGNSLQGYPPWDYQQFAALLNEVRWQTWTDTERAAITQWFCTWMQHAAIAGNGNINDATNCAGLCGCDLTAAFRDFREFNRAASLQWLALTMEYHWQELLATGWPSGWRNYWGDASAPDELGVDFIVLLLRRSSIGALQGAFFAEPETKKQSLLSAAIEHAEACLRYAHHHPQSPLAVAAMQPQMAS